MQHCGLWVQCILHTCHLDKHQPAQEPKFRQERASNSQVPESHQEEVTLGLCGRALIERWRKEIERPPANAPGKGQAPSQATGSQQKPASQAAPGPARAAAVGSQRPPPEAKRAPLGEPAKPSTLAGKLPAMKAEQIVRSLKPVDPKRTAIHGADVRTDLSSLPGPHQTQQSGLSSQVSAVRKNSSSLSQHHAFPRAGTPKLERLIKWMMDDQMRSSAVYHNG